MRANWFCGFCIYVFFTGNSYGEISTTSLISEHVDAEAIAQGLKSSHRRKKISLIFAIVGVACVVIGCVVGAAIVLTQGGDEDTSAAPVDEAYTPSPRISYPGRMVFNKQNWNSYKVGAKPEVYKDFGAIMAGCSGMLRIDQICGWKQV